MARSGSQNESSSSATTLPAANAAGRTSEVHSVAINSALVITSRLRPRCSVNAASLRNSRRPATWLFARRTPFATASSFPRTSVKSV